MKTTFNYRELLFLETVLDLALTEEFQGLATFLREGGDRKEVLEKVRALIKEREDGNAPWRANAAQAYEDLKDSARRDADS